MAELGLAVVGLTLQGVELYKKIDNCHKDGKDASFRIQHIQGNLKSTNPMLAELKTILATLESLGTATSSKMGHDLTNFQHEIAMIGDLFTSLAALISKYDDSGSDGPMLQAGRFTSAQKLRLKHKWTWAKDDLKQAEKLGQMLAGHMANLSFALQVLNTIAVYSIGKAIDRNHADFEEHAREMIALQINNMRKSDLENDPQFTSYLESIAVELNSALAVEAASEIEDDAAGNEIFQAEIDRDRLLVDLRKVVEEKMESDRELLNTMEAKVQIDQELKHIYQIRGRNNKCGMAFGIIVLCIWDIWCPTDLQSFSHICMLGLYTLYTKYGDFWLVQQGLDILGRMAPTEENRYWAQYPASRRAWSVFLYTILWLDGITMLIFLFHYEIWKEDPRLVVICILTGAILLAVMYELWEPEPPDLHGILHWLGSTLNRFRARARSATSRIWSQQREAADQAPLLPICKVEPAT